MNPIFSNAGLKTHYNGHAVSFFVFVFLLIYYLLFAGKIISSTGIWAVVVVVVYNYVFHIFRILFSCSATASYFYLCDFLRFLRNFITRSNRGINPFCWILNAECYIFFSLLLCQPIILQQESMYDSSNQTMNIHVFICIRSNGYEVWAMVNGNFRCLSHVVVAIFVSREFFFYFNPLLTVLMVSIVFFSYVYMGIMSMRLRYMPVIQIIIICLIWKTNMEKYPHISFADAGHWTTTTNRKTTRWTNNNQRITQS